MSPPTSRPIALAVLLVAAVVACGGTEASPAPSPTPSASSEASTAATATPKPSPTPTPGPTPSPTPQTLEINGPVIYLDDPDFEMTLPEGWREVSAIQLLGSLDYEAAVFGMTDREVEVARTDLESGVIASSAQGMTGGGINTGIVLYIVPGLKTIDDAVGWLKDLSPPELISSIQSYPLNIRLGRAIAIRMLNDVAPEHQPNGVPSQTVAYAYRLDDGRTLIVSGISFQTDDGFPRMMERVVASLHESGPRDPSRVKGGGWRESIPDTGLAFTLPRGWDEVPLDLLAGRLDDALALVQVETADRIAVQEDLRDKGSLVQLFLTDTMVAGSTESLSVRIDDGDKDLKAAVRRLIAEDAPFSTSMEVTQRNVSLLSGKAVMIQTVATATASVSRQQIAYVIRLKDGRTLTLTGVAWQPEPTFADVMRGIATSLATSRTGS